MANNCIEEDVIMDEQEQGVSTYCLASSEFESDGSSEYPCSQSSDDLASDSDESDGSFVLTLILTPTQ